MTAKLFCWSSANTVRTGVSYCGCALLHKLSEKFVIVTAWPGYLEEGKLCYDKFDGTESIRISSEGFTVWNVD